LAVTVGVAVQKGWFERKVEFHSFLTSAEGLHPGTEIHMQGLRAGSVSYVELMEAEKVKVGYSVFAKFVGKIKEDSQVQLVRPFIIGEKVVEISVGSADAKSLRAGSELEVVPSFDIMEVMSGRKMGPLLASVEKLTGSVQTLLEAFADEDRMKSLVSTFDRIGPLIVNLSVLTKDVVKITKTATKKKNLDKILSNLVILTTELNKVLPSFNEEAPDAGTQLAQVVRSLNTLTVEFQKLTPAIAAVAPELPKTSLRAVEALNEAVVTLKAIQKSFFLRGNVEEVREEEAKQAETKSDGRTPANDSKDDDDDGSFF
jgi:phospholipid/cholesterol/gamma-HCH transport system substrate-binding protein